MAISLGFTVDNINTVIQIYNALEVQRAPQELPADLTNYTTLSGVSGHPIILLPGQTQYTLFDSTGISSSWYRSRYVNTSTLVSSAWSDPVLGEAGDLYYNPLFPPEIAYGSADQLIISTIRRFIGDPISLKREYGDEAASSIHSDGRVYEFDSDKGWPVSVNMGGVAMNDSTNPSVNGYKYLIFDQDITTIATVSGIEYGVDIWYYTFRFSDREIMESYDSCFPPAGLTSANATSEAYMLQTSIDLLMRENFENSVEDGAVVFDEGSKYDPSPGFVFRKYLMDKLQRRLDDIIRQLRLYNGGVLID